MLGQTSGGELHWPRETRSRAFGMFHFGTLELSLVCAQVILREGRGVPPWFTYYFQLVLRLHAPICDGQAIQ
jgi:hypothetical protein